MSNPVKYINQFQAKQKFRFNSQYLLDSRYKVTINGTQI